MGDEHGREVPMTRYSCEEPSAAVGFDSSRPAAACRRREPPTEGRPTAVGSAGFAGANPTAPGRPFREGRRPNAILGAVKRLGIGLALAGLALFWLGCPAGGGGRTSPRVLLIGIDGADLQIIDRLIAEGKLPTFQRLEREGAFGPLRSQEPLLSPIVWTTIATGRKPEDHGILDFVEIWADGP